MNKRCFNKIDMLLNDDTDHSRLILDMVCIFFNFGKDMFGNDYIDLLIEYIVNNNQTVDEIVINCSTSHSNYYRKIKEIFNIIDKMDELIKEAFIEMKIDDSYIESIIHKLI